MAPWAVVSRASGRAVGMTTYMNIDAPNRRVEIGSTWLGRDAQGTGVNPAAKLLLLERAFEELGCIAVEFRTHWHNGQSRAAIAKLGRSRTECCATTRCGRTERCATPSCSRSSTASGPRSGRAWWRDSSGADRGPEALRGLFGCGSGGCVPACPPPWPPPVRRRLRLRLGRGVPSADAGAPWLRRLRVVRGPRPNRAAAATASAALAATRSVATRRTATSAITTATTDRHHDRHDLTAVTSTATASHVHRGHLSRRLRDACRSRQGPQASRHPGPRAPARSGGACPSCPRGCRGR